LIIQEKIHINLMGQGAIRKGMNQDLLYKMKKAGFNSITYGVESFSNKVLQLMNKPYTYDEIKRIIRCTKKAGIRVYINIVVGFPGEGEEEFSETVKRLKECRRYLDGISSLAPCLITLGSYLQRNLEKYKIIYSGIDGYFSWYSEDGNNYEMRKKRVKTILSVADKLFFSVGTVNLYDEFQDVENNKEEIKSLAIEQRTAEKKRVDILLVTFPPWGVENPPLGLGYLNSYMRHKGLNSIVYDFNIHFYNTVESSYKMLWHVENKNFWSNEKTFPLICEIFKEQIDYAVEKILSIDTGLIGFSVVDPKERLTIEVIKRIKNIAPQKKIILGGPACSTEEQRDFFEENIPGYIDYFVVGEGEETLYEIVQKEKGILKKDRLEGIAFKINGKWQYEPRPYIDLENIPFPRYEGFDLSQYNGGKSVLVEWSRGCIGRCAFCKNYRLEGIFRIRSPENIIKELEFLLSHYGVKEFTIRDNIMNGDIKHLNTVCEEIIKRKFRLRWSGQITPRKEMDYELFRKMFEAGCYRIQIGVESGADKVLRNMRKFYVSRIAQDNIRQAKRAGMEVEVFIMVGFPGEGEEEFKETYNFIRRNAAYIDTIKSINTLHLIAGTDVYENYPKYNLRTLPERNWHYLWETTDGNNYSKRKERAQRLLNLACDLGLKVMETNIKEGKEELFLDIHYKEPLSKQLERLKIEINRLQELPQRRTRRILKNHSLFKFILLGFIFIYILFYITYFWVFKKIRGKFLLGGE
ncbi:MAG: radical SAM protein, partial [Candidatus Omnitrophota bacterium]